MCRLNWELLQWPPLVDLGPRRGTSPAGCSVIRSVAISWILLEVQKNHRPSCLQICVFTRFPGDSCTLSSWRSTARASTRRSQGPMYGPGVCLHTPSQVSLTASLLLSLRQARKHPPFVQQILTERPVGEKLCYQGLGIKNHAPLQIKCSDASGV